MDCVEGRGPHRNEVWKVAHGRWWFCLLYCCESLDIAFEDKLGGAYREDGEKNE